MRLRYLILCLVASAVIVAATDKPVNALMDELFTELHAASSAAAEQTEDHQLANDLSNDYGLDAGKDNQNSQQEEDDNNNSQDDEDEEPTEDMEDVLEGLKSGSQKYVKKLNKLSKVKCSKRALRSVHNLIKMSWRSFAGCLYDNNGKSGKKKSSKKTGVWKSAAEAKSVLQKLYDIRGKLENCKGKKKAVKKIKKKAVKKIKKKAVKKIAKKSKCSGSKKLGGECNPATSCLEIKQKRKDSPASGAFYIKYEGKVYHVFCDMKTQGGGWTALINPANIDAEGLPLTTVAKQVAGSVNSCGAKFSRDSLYGFHRLKGYSCGDSRVEWTITWKNSFGAKDVLIAGAIQGHNSRSLSVNGKNVDYTGVTGTDNNYCAFINGDNKSVKPGVNNCYDLDSANDAPAKYINTGKLGGELSVKIASGT